MRRKAAALMLCVLLAVQLAAPQALAEEKVYFVAVGNNVLPLSDATMPFWSGGYLYISSTIFTGIVWNSIGIAHSYNSAQQLEVLYNRDRDKSLVFDLKQNNARDGAGNIYYPGAVKRNGTVFVPASIVASCFGLQYSLIPDVEHGYLVWLRGPGYGLSDKEYADAAAYPMAYCYDQYLKSKETSPTTSGKPADTSPVQTASGKSIYLCLEADSTAPFLLTVLDQYDARAAFFCSLEFLETQGDLLRRMSATGQAIGLLVDASDSQRTVAEQLEAGNQALYRATCGKTRLAYVKNGDAAAVQAAEDAGFRCLLPDLDRSGYGLRSTSNAESLLQKVSARRNDVTVWLADTANNVGLRAFLAAAEEGENRCLPLTETA